MNPTCVDFLFDYISPNAYLAWRAIHELAGRHGRSVRPSAVLYAALLNANGATGPAETPTKWEWMVRDVLRKAHRLGVPLRSPASHPFNPLLALRATCVPLEPEQRTGLIDGLFSAAWAESRHIDDPEVVAQVGDAAGLDGRALVEQARAQAVKFALREQTERALSRGVFGVPTLIVDGEIFWGLDDFDHLEERLAGRDRLDPDELESWSRVRPSADRRAGRGGS